MLPWILQNAGVLLGIAGPIGAGAAAYFIGPAVVTRFIAKNWQLVALGVVLLLGFLVINSQLNARADAEAAAAEARAEVQRMEQEAANAAASATRDALALKSLRQRLESEAAAAKARATNEAARAAEATQRRQNAERENHALRERLENTPDCDCGVGPAIVDRMRDDREARARQLDPSARRDGPASADGMRSSAGPNAAAGAGTPLAEPERLRARPTAGRAPSLRGFPCGVGAPGVGALTRLARPGTRPRVMRLQIGDAHAV